MVCRWFFAFLLFLFLIPDHLIELVFRWTPHDELYERNQEEIQEFLKLTLHLEK